MRYFEFNTKDFPYYALIGAPDKSGAISLYEDVVCDIECGESPKEVTEIEAIDKIAFASLGKRVKADDCIKNLKENVHSDESFFILLDGCLS